MKFWQQPKENRNVLRRKFNRLRSEIQTLNEREQQLTNQLSYTKQENSMRQKELQTLLTDYPDVTIEY